MSFLDLVSKRKSCRKYLPNPIPRESINRCLKAAQLSPSACNSQPWHFIVIQNEQLKSRVADKAFSGIHSMNAFAKNAPVLIAVIREGSKYAAELGGSLRGVQYSLIDLGIACEHLILQAAEEDLGTCWIGWFNERAVKKELRISKNKKIDILISLGYPEEELEIIEKKRKDISEISEVL